MSVNIESPAELIRLLPSALIANACDPDRCFAHADKHGDAAHGYCPFGVVGLSYRTATIDLRGRASFDPEKSKLFLEVLRENGVGEAMVLSTCNRTEVYFSGPDHDKVIRLFALAIGSDLAEIQPHLYLKGSVCAACHLFRVVSGLDSAVLGETEIVAQVKNAWRTSEEAGSCGGGLAMLLQRAMEVNKRIRTETDLNRGVTSIATLAVSRAEEHLGSLQGKNVLIVGAGRIAERVCKELLPAELGSLTIVNRTLSNAESLARPYRGKAVDINCLESAIAGADVVISASASQVPIIDDGLLRSRTQPLLLIDLGVPANIRLQTPREGITVLDVDSLAATCSKNLERRAQAVPVALDLLEEELQRLRSDLTMRTASPTIKALVNQAEQIRILNLQWAMERMPGLSDKERKVVEDLSNRIIKGLLQAPIQGLKHELAAMEHREIVTKLFKLEEAVNDPLAS